MLSSIMPKPKPHLDTTKQFCENINIRIVIWGVQILKHLIIYFPQAWFLMTIGTALVFYGYEETFFFDKESM